MADKKAWHMRVTDAAEAYRVGILSAGDLHHCLRDMGYMPDDANLIASLALEGRAGDGKVNLHGITPKPISFHRCDYCGVPAVQGRVTCPQCGGPYHARP